MIYSEEELNLESQELLDTVSANVAKIRQAKGFSQLKLAIDIGLNGGAYLGRMEIRAKNHRFNLEHLAKIAKVLNVDICEFFKPINQNLCDINEL
jgi:putative transcriptional regulator